jgi:hypothetical protein
VNLLLGYGENSWRVFCKTRRGFPVLASLFSFVLETVTNLKSTQKKGELGPTVFALQAIAKFLALFLIVCLLMQSFLLVYFRHFGAFDGPLVTSCSHILFAVSTSHPNVVLGNLFVLSLSFMLLVPTLLFFSHTNQIRGIMAGIYNRDMSCC